MESKTAANFPLYKSSFRSKYHYYQQPPPSFFLYFFLPFSDQESDRKSQHGWPDSFAYEYLAALDFLPSPITFCFALPSFYSQLSRLLYLSKSQHVCNFPADSSHRGRIQGSEKGRGSQGKTTTDSNQFDTIKPEHVANVACTRWLGSYRIVLLWPATKPNTAKRVSASMTSKPASSRL